ncbi:AAEL005304-PA [Aedes aegypti]|uniref:AAEL005304-PA n=1 Tax=Aedes aegypti TaxID=7159 RepID=Q17AI1_AEDAE|nr:AAEL005304-PA [Aedes aegypti]
MFRSNAIVIFVSIQRNVLPITAKQRASVKWLLSKAYNNRVPEFLKDPFYRDHEGQDHLKPQIVVGLGNASIYCQVLSNIYSDPNYQSLNHWSILQTLSRKGVPLNESPDLPLTETVLIQTNPLRINAHMTVIEALMVLYAKEVASSGRISSALERISGRSVSQGAQHHEAALLSWISHVCSALKRRIDYELTNGVGGGNGGGGGTNPAVDEYGQRLQSPTIAPVRDFRELCDGVCLAYLISYYCPKLVPWHSVKFNHVPTIEDSIHNILIVSNFSERSLPYSVFHMTPEDITYMRGAMKQNLVVLLADLFNLFEIHPAKCVCYPGMEQQQVAVTRSPSASTLRKHVSTRDMHDQQQPQYSQHPQQSHQPYHQDQDEGVPTLSSMQEPLVPARIRQAKEKTNNDSKAEERGDSIPAGRPSNWEENRKQSFSGRRSRRNSLSEDSQLTIENFGGSQDQLNTIGRFDRERKTSSASLTSVEPVTPARSSIADARGSIQFGYDTDSSGNEKQDRDTEKPTPALRRHNSTNLHSSSVERDIIDGDMSATHGFGGGSGPAGPVSVADVETTPRRKTSFATLPNNTTTWQQQAISVQKMEDVDDSQSGFEDATKISTIKLKLEEKRRLIEQEKRRMETAWSKQLQTVGKQAFLQAINKWNAQIIEPKKTPDLENMDLEQYQNAPLLQQQSPINYGTRPPSRDPYLSQQQQLHTLQYVNDQGQYIQQAQQQQQQQQQQHYMGYENGQYRKENQYSSNPYLNIDQQQQQFYQDSNHYRDPYLPQEVKEPPIQQSQQPQHNQFFLHDSSGGGGGGGGLGTPPQPAQRRTWAQSAAAAANQRGSSASSDIQLDINAWNQGIKSSPYNKSPSQSGFSLHHNGDSGGDGYGTNSRYGGSQQSFQNLFEVHHGSSSSPQHSRVRNQISQMINHGGSSNSSPGAETRNSHHDSFRDNRNMPLSPPIDDMAPQSISFIGDEDTGDIEINTSKGTSFTLRQQHQQDQLEQLYGSSKPGSNKLQHNNGPELNKHLSKLNITSGNRTYRIPSPTRPTLNSNSFHDPQQDEVNEKGFYISFDNEQPKRPKPPLRTKRSPKKDKLGDGMEHNKESEKPSHRENNQNNFGTFSVKTANSFSANFNEEQVVSRKSIIDSASSPFETAATGSSRASNNNMAATMERDIGERRHLEDVTNHTSTGSNAMNNNNIHHYNNNNGDGYGSENENQRKAKLVIGNDEGNLDPNSVDEMERKKEKIMLLSLQRRQQAEEAKARKEIEAMQRREKEREKEEERARKKEEQFARRQAILEAHKLKKAIEEAEREGKTIDRELLIKHQQSQAQLHQSSRGGDGGMHHQTSSTPAAKMRPQKLSRPRPKTIHVETGSVDLSETSSLSSRGKKGSNSNLTGIGLHSSNSMRRDYYRGSQDSLAIRESPDEYPSSSSTPIGRRGSYKTGREPATIERGRTLSRISLAKGANFRGRKSNSLMNLCGPKLYKQPATKSNRGIILNAVEYCVFPGAVNREAKQKVLEKIARSEAKHFLVLFRDAGCQFRALYGYWPENEQIIKLYGTGPSQVDDVMFDKFFKYNSGGKCFSQVHTKHLTVTIDAFTIHNSLWQGKKANLPSKKDMALVI